MHETKGWCHRRELKNWVEKGLKVFTILWCKEAVRGSGDEGTKRRKSLGRHKPGIWRRTHVWNAPSIGCMKRIWYIQHEGKSYAKHQRKLCIIVGGGRILRKHHIPLEKESRRYEQASTKFIRRVSKLYMNEPSSKTERPKCTYLSGPKALGTNVAKADSIAEWLESPSNCNKAVKNLDRLLRDRVTKKDCHAHETISCKAIVLSSL